MRFQRLDPLMNGLDYPVCTQKRPITPAQIAQYIDFSLLKPQLTNQQIIDGCNEAVHYDCLTVAVTLGNVPLVSSVVKGTSTLVKVAVGFPHGNTAPQIKAFEAELSLAAGVCEVDMVMNIGRFCSGDYGYVEDEIRLLADICHAAGSYLHVILETAYLTNENIIRAAKLVEQAGADVVKTSTGFAPTGATMENMRLIKQSISPTMLIKAASGVRTLDQALAVIASGCCRFGCTATKVILEEAAAREAAGALFVPAISDIPEDVIKW